MKRQEDRDRGAVGGGGGRGLRAPKSKEWGYLLSGLGV